MTHARLEACSVCQLKCPSCSTGRGENVKTLGNGYLLPKNFEKFLDLNPSLISVELSNFGEVFLNPKIAEIFKIGFERGVEITLSNGANLNTITDEAIEALVKYRVRNILVSVDGASNSTYKLYRKGGSFKQVITNIIRINNAKYEHKSDFPNLIWQFIPFSHNEHEFEQAKALAMKLNMDWKPKRSFDRKRFVATGEYDFSTVTRNGEVKADNGTSGQALGNRKCMQLWNTIVINWNGDVLGCCANSKMPFEGNAFEESLESLVQKEKYTYAKDMLFGKVPARDDIVCTTCSSYKNILKDNRRIEIKEIT